MRESTWYMLECELVMLEFSQVMLEFSELWRNLSELCSFRDFTPMINGTSKRYSFILAYFFQHFHRYIGDICENPVRTHLNHASDFVFIIYGERMDMQVFAMRKVH